MQQQYRVGVSDSLVCFSSGQVLVNDGLQEAYAELKKTAKAWYPQLTEDANKKVETPNET